MAKVDGPLMSLEARGKIADAIVFFPWKGRHVVRQWLKPRQPNEVLQGYVRASLYAIGKWVKQIWSISGKDAVNSKVYSLLTSAAPVELNWNAFACQGFLLRLKSAGAFVTGSLTALVSEYTGLTAAVLTAFKTDATALGMADFSFDYGYTTAIEAGCQLYFGALACYYNNIAVTAPYNTHPTGWAVADVDNFKTQMVATA